MANHSGVVDVQVIAAAVAAALTSTNPVVPAAGRSVIDGPGSHSSRGGESESLRGTALTRGRGGGRAARVVVGREGKTRASNNHTARGGSGRGGGKNVQEHVLSGNATKLNRQVLADPSSPDELVLSQIQYLQALASLRGLEVEGGVVAVRYSDKPKPARVLVPSQTGAPSTTNDSVRTPGTTTVDPTSPGPEQPLGSTEPKKGTLKRKQQRARKAAREQVGGENTVTKSSGEVAPPVSSIVVSTPDPVSPPGPLEQKVSASAVAPPLEDGAGDDRSQTFVESPLLTHARSLSGERPLAMYVPSGSSKVPEWRRGAPAS